MNYNGFFYWTDFLSGSQERNFLQWLKTVIFHYPMMRGRKLKRGTLQFGYEYQFAERAVQQTAKIPEIILDIIPYFNELYPIERDFDQCIVTEYTNGSGIGWHTDAKYFGDLILGVSLGGTAQMDFRKPGEKTIYFSQELASNSVYLMTGEARWKYQHQIKPVKETRYSLTFRTVHLKNHLNLKCISTPTEIN